MANPAQGRPPYKAIQVANEFINLGKKDGITDLTNMKLQKLVFFAHSVMLCDTGTPLIKEKIRAWKHGPVVSELYWAICDLCNDRHWDRKHRFSEEIPGGTEPVTDQNALDAISDTWEVCKSSSAGKLAKMSHLSGSPWSTVYNTLGEFAIITNELICDYMRRSSNEQVA